MEQSGYLEGKVHFFPVRVYYSDTDAGGVVYHGRYLDMAEHARTELLRLTGREQVQAMTEEQTGFIVQSLSISYHRPAYLDDLLLVKTSITRQGRFSMILRQEFSRDSEHIAVMEIKVGYVSLEDGKPKPIPQVWKDLQHNS